MRTSINSFGSGEHPEPPSCFVDVYADQKSGTAKRLHYKVPVLGVEEYLEICINLSLRLRYDTSERNFSSNSNIQFIYIFQPNLKVLLLAEIQFQSLLVMK